MSATTNNTSVTAVRACTCKCHCPTCGNHYDASRTIGWDRAYCSPLCEKKADDKRAAAFAAWWDRPRA